MDEDFEELQTRLAQIEVVIVEQHKTTMALHRALKEQQETLVMLAKAHRECVDIVKTIGEHSQVLNGRLCNLEAITGLNQVGNN